MTTTVIAKSKNKMSCPLTATRIQSFQKTIYDYYDVQGRDLPWRKRMNPYRVLVSEIMLQQTQVERVTKKYGEFLAAFPDFSTLSKAPNAKLLKVWSGLGYNRRALSLKALAQKVMSKYQGRLPSGPEELIVLPGIGKYTAGAVTAFAFNKPVVFLDTNIRRVYINGFFQNRENIHDDELLPLVEQTMDRMNPRKWFNALMDYGTMLRQKHVKSNRKSVHYVRRSPFENSNRQVRGKILKAIVARSPLTTAQIVKATGIESERIQKNLEQLAKEGFIIKTGVAFSIS